jgi:Ca2+/Na+ antiporter
MKALMSMILLIVILFGPGALIYFIQDHPYNYIILLGMFITSVTVHLLFAKKLGWKIDKEVKKQHSW